MGPVLVESSTIAIEIQSLKTESKHIMFCIM